MGLPLCALTPNKFCSLAGISDSRSQGYISNRLTTSSKNGYGTIPRHEVKEGVFAFNLGNYIAVCNDYGFFVDKQALVQKLLEAKKTDESSPELMFF